MGALPHLLRPLPDPRSDSPCLYSPSDTIPLRDDACRPSINVAQASRINSSMAFMYIPFAYAVQLPFLLAMPHLRS